MKYELTGETNGAGLRRIRAVRDIPRHGVKVGDLGGWIESEANLAQHGDARVYGDAQVSQPNHVLSLSGLITPNADGASIVRTTDGHYIRLGCWEGTATELRALAASEEWPSGREAACREKWRPSLLAVAALAEAVVATWDDDEAAEAVAS